MKIRIVDGRCPICGSDNIRSKVGDKNNVWWYICDNEDCRREIVVEHREVVKLEWRFYFTLPGSYKRQYIEGADKIFYKIGYHNWKEQV